MVNSVQTGHYTIEGVGYCRTEHFCLKFKLIHNNSKAKQIETLVVSMS